MQLYQCMVQLNSILPMHDFYCCSLQIVYSRELAKVHQGCHGCLAEHQTVQEEVNLMIITILAYWDLSDNRDLNQDQSLDSSLQFLCGLFIVAMHGYTL